MLLTDVEADAEQEVEVSLDLLVGFEAPRPVPGALIERFEGKLENGAVDALANTSVMLDQAETSVDVVLLV